MDFYESDLEDIVFNALKSQQGCAKLHSIGLKLPHKPTLVFRQLRIGNYGVADIVTVSKWYFQDKPYLGVTIYELKRNDLDEKALIQSQRYSSGIKHYLSLRGYSNVSVDVILIGRKISTSDWVYMMEDSLVEVYTYQYGIDGMKFSRENFGYQLTNPNFIFKK